MFCFGASVQADAPDCAGRDHCRSWRTRCWSPTAPWPRGSDFPSRGGTESCWVRVEVLHRCPAGRPRKGYSGRNSFARQDIAILPNPPLEAMYGPVAAGPWSSLWDQLSRLARLPRSVHVYGSSAGRSVDRSGWSCPDRAWIGSWSVVDRADVVSVRRYAEMGVLRPPIE